MEHAAVAGSFLRMNEEEERRMSSDFINTTAGDVDWATMDERSL